MTVLYSIQLAARWSHKKTPKMDNVRTIMCARRSSRRDIIIVQTLTHHRANIVRRTLCSSICSTIHFVRHGNTHSVFSASWADPMASSAGRVSIRRSPNNDYHPSLPLPHLRPEVDGLWLGEYRESFRCVCARTARHFPHSLLFLSL